MRRTFFYETILSVFVVSIVVANVVGARVITTGLCLFGFELCASGGCVTYALTFLSTDIIGELYGKKAASNMVKYGFIGQIFALAMIIATGWLRPVDSVVDSAYNILLGQNAFFVCGSLCAYAFSQWWDVCVFHSIKDWYVRKFCQSGYSGQGRWIWNNASTITSQFMDTFIYAVISFGIGQKWFANGMIKEFVGLAIGQYIIKVALALLDTPFFYLFTSEFVRRKIEKD